MIVSRARANYSLVSFRISESNGRIGRCLCHASLGRRGAADQAVRQTQAVEIHLATYRGHVADNRVTSLGGRSVVVNVVHLEAIFARKVAVKLGMPQQS